MNNVTVLVGPPEVDRGPRSLEEYRAQRKALLRAKAMLEKAVDDKREKYRAYAEALRVERAAQRNVLELIR